MPFVRCTRDKRGYEHIYLMHASGRRGKASKPRILYWFRTPPGVKVGREPFDETVRRTIEAQNPGVAFDWKKLSVIPQAPVDVEYWRERRRNERAAKQARRAEQTADAPETEANEAAADAEAADEAIAAIEGEEDTGETAEGIEAASSEPSISEEIDEEPAAEDAPPIATSAATPTTSPAQRRRRRRGGRRRRRKHHQPAQAGQPIQDTEAQASAPVESAETPNAGDTASKNE